MNALRKINVRKRIALVAHDSKKNELIAWTLHNKKALENHELIATGTTGTLLEQTLGLSIKKMLSGPFGGDQQLGAMIAQGEIDILIFFEDPMGTQPHDNDVKALLRMGVTWNILLASDRTTADFIVSSPLMKQEYEMVLPNYSHYLNRAQRA
jgi:methylglyoxal synthase